MTAQRALIAALLILLPACSASVGGSSEPSTGTVGGSVASPTPSTAPALTLVDMPKVTFSGSSTKNTATFALGSPMRIDYTATGTGNFIVTLTDPADGPVASIANLIGKAAGTTWVYGASGTAYFEVLADEAWAISAAAELPAVASLPVTLEGTTNEVTMPFSVAGGVTVKWTHMGTGNFIVELIDASDGSPADSVANFIGKGSDTTVLYGHSGIFSFDVIADGGWILEVTPS